MNAQVGGQAVLGRQNILPTPWLTERHGYDPTFADFPYLHYSSWPEAANLGDLMRFRVRPGVK